MFNKADQERIAALKKQVTDLESRIEAQEAEKIRLQAEAERVEDELLTVRAEHQRNERLAREAETKISAVNAQLAAVNAELAAKNAKLATYDAEVEKAAAARFAGLGGNPLPECGKDDNTDPKTSGLTGLARATAIHKAQSQASQSNPSNQ